MARATGAEWRIDHQLWIEIFVIGNFGALVFDIYLAHSGNGFRRAAEYIPLYFSAAAPLALLAGVAVRERENALWRDVGFVIGWLAVLVGVTGVILHLDSQFFHARTLKSLTYAAPFAAPLAYTGLGLLLIVNRMVKPNDIEWAQWVVLLAVGGFAGYFVFSLTDHAMNGFFNAAEWVPVVSSAFAVSFLLVPFLMEVTRRFLMLCAAVLGVQAVGPDRIRPPFAGCLPAARFDLLRAAPHGRAAHGAAAVPQPGDSRTHRTVGARPATAFRILVRLCQVSAPPSWRRVCARRSIAREDASQSSVSFRRWASTARDRTKVSELACQPKLAQQQGRPASADATAGSLRVMRERRLVDQTGIEPVTS